VTDTSGVVDRIPPPGVDTSSSHSARVWNYWLGGKDNYLVDHEAGDQFATARPCAGPRSPSKR
jgi:hypothetical protein